MKKYMDVVRHGKTFTHSTLEGNPKIVIQEKLDGANASFKRDGNEIICFSRNTQLDEHNTLRNEKSNMPLHLEKQHMKIATVTQVKGYLYQKSIFAVSSVLIGMEIK